MLLDELEVRRAAMAYLAELMSSSGGMVTRTQLEAFSYGGEQLKLIDQSRGIRNPRQLTATLSILSQPRGPYDDVETEDGLLRYAYRDGDPGGGDNRKLRRAAELGLPLLLLASAISITIRCSASRRHQPCLIRSARAGASGGLVCFFLRVDMAQGSTGRAPPWAG